MNNEKDWKALLEIFPKEGFNPNEKVKKVADYIFSAYESLALETDRVWLTQDDMALIVSDEEVLRFLTSLLRRSIIEDLYIPLKITRGPGKWINYTYGPHYSSLPILAEVALRDPGKLKKQFVGFTMIDWEGFIGVRNKVYEILQLEVTKEMRVNSKLTFSDEKGVVYSQGKELEIPRNTNQYFLCKKLFSVKTGVQIQEQEIIDMADWAKDSKRSVYDATRLVNQKIKNAFGVAGPFRYKTNRVWREE